MSEQVQVGNDAVVYYCSLCGEYESKDSSNVMRHITKSEDEIHKDNKGSWSYIKQREPEEMEPKTIERTKGSATYKGPSGGLDMTMTSIRDRPFQEPVETIALDTEIVFEIIRNGDPDVARKVFNDLLVGHSVVKEEEEQDEGVVVSENRT